MPGGDLSGTAMSYLRGPGGSEVQLLPACLDDYVAANAPARLIDAYAEGLDFTALGVVRARLKDTGRRPYHPADLLKLCRYGCLHRVRSRPASGGGGAGTRLVDGWAVLPGIRRGLKKGPG